MASDLHRLCRGHTFCHFWGNVIQKFSEISVLSRLPQNTTMKRKLGALEKVEADLPNLQAKIKRDPISYKDDFANQYQQYRAFLSLFIQAPTSSDEQGIISIREQIDFVAHVADCYPEISGEFSSDLISLLEKHHAVLDAELRDKIVGSLVLLRRKEIIDSQR